MMASQGSDRDEKVCVTRGHHIYKRIWIPVIGELVLKAKDMNKHDNHTVTVMNDEYIIGHIPHAIVNIPVQIYIERCHVLC